MKTNLFAKSTGLMAVVAIAGLFTSCYEKLAVEDMTIEVGKEYNSRFEEIIGKFDPTHTWSTASTSMLNVDVQIPGKHTIRILTEDPAYSKDAYLLAKFEVNGGVKTMREFTRPAGIKSFVVVLDEGKNRQVYKAKVESDEDIEVLFGSLSSSSAETRAGSSIVPTESYNNYQFHLDDDAVYVTSMPSDAKDYNDYKTKGAAPGNYYIQPNSESNRIQVNTWTENVNLFFGPGKYYLSGDISLAKNNKVYILSGAEVNIEEGKNLTFGQAYDENRLVICDGGCLKVNGLYNSGIKAYNRGTFEVRSFTLNSNGYFCNVGNVLVGETKIINGKEEIVYGKFTPANDFSEFVNIGEFRCGDLDVQGSSHMLNTGSVITFGETAVTSNNATWVNEGVYVANTFRYTAGSNDIVNKCRLTVKDTFTMSPADNSDGSICFTMTDGAIIAANTVVFEKGQMNMGSGAMISADVMVMDYTKPDLGIHGVGSQYAVLVANKITTSNLDQQYDVTYYGNLIVDTPDHFERRFTGHFYNYYFEDGATFASNLAEVPTFSANRCSPIGYTPGVIIPVPVNGKPMSWIIACEDLGDENSDFDYNDVVFEVVPYDDGMAKIKPVAAGGTLEAYIQYRVSTNEDWTTAEVELDGGVTVSEVHQWISQNPNASPTRMLNTSETGSLDYPLDDIPALDAYIGSFASEGFSDYYRIIVVKRDGSEETITSSTNYDITDPRFVNAPRLICISGESPEWCWMKERHCIDLGYLNFASWARNKNQDEDWYRLTKSNEAHLEIRNMVSRSSRGIVLKDEDAPASTTTPTTPSVPEVEEEPETGSYYELREGSTPITSTTVYNLKNGEIKAFALYKIVQGSPDAKITSGITLTSSNSDVVVCTGTTMKISASAAYTGITVTAKYNDEEIVTFKVNVEYTGGGNSGTFDLSSYGVEVPYEIRNLNGNYKPYIEKGNISLTGNVIITVAYELRDSQANIQGPVILGIPDADNKPWLQDQLTTGSITTLENKRAIVEFELNSSSIDNYPGIAYYANYANGDILGIRVRNK